MRPFMIAAGLLFACAGMLLATAPAEARKKKKTEAEELAELKAKVKAKYVDDKGGMLFDDYVYWVDMEKAGDTRWNRGSARGGAEAEPQWVVFHASWMPAIDAKPEQIIEVLGWRYRHVTKNEGAADSVHSLTFQNTGESVPNSDAKKLCDAQRKNWLATAKDVNEKETVEVKKKKVGEAKYYAAAEGAEPEGNQRQRKEWYGWVNGKRGESYVLTVTYGASVFDKTDKVEDLLKAIKVVSEMK